MCTSFNLTFLFNFQNKKKQLQIKIGWKHQKNNTFKKVPVKDGGGLRSLQVPRNATIQEVLEVAKSAFILQTRVFGIETKDLECWLGHKNEKVTFHSYESFVERMRQQGLMALNLYLHTVSFQARKITFL